MQKQPVITFRNMDRSEAIEDHLLSRVEELEKYHPRIIGCNLVVIASDTKQVTGREFEVQLTISVPGPDIYISRKVGRSGASEDVNVAIHKVFDAARRTLKEQDRKMGRVDVKHHAPLLHGTIDRLFEGEGYGFIKANDGREVYFGKDSLTTGDWEKIRVDMKVRFHEEIGDKGPYAANVAIME